MASMEREIGLLETAQGAAGSGKRPQEALFASFADLVKQLALGPEPEVRECPHCKGIGMLAATRCGTCWAKLSPPAPAT